jgi:hypothetical protein
MITAIAAALCGTTITVTWAVCIRAIRRPAPRNDNPDG